MKITKIITKLEIWYISSPIGSIELKLTDCTKRSMVDIHTKFEVN